MLCLVMVLVNIKGAAAHLPHIVGKDVTRIDRPEISQVFYAVLEGEKDIYRLSSDSDFLLHLGLLVPYLPQARRDFMVEVLQAHGHNYEQLFILDGKSHVWEEFFEPFAGDRYWRGPEISKKVTAGEYLVQVTNTDNKGKYVLTVGQKDSLRFTDLLQTCKRLPAVKSFLLKSPYTAFFNLMGLFMLLALCVAGVLIFLLHRLAKSRI